MCCKKAVLILQELQGQKDTNALVGELQAQLNVLQTERDSALQATADIISLNANLTLVSVHL